MEIDIRILQDIGASFSTVFDRRTPIPGKCITSVEISGIGVLSCSLHLNEPHLILLVEKIAGLTVDPACITYAHASRLK